MTKKIYIFTSGSEPIPPVNGGGVENVIMAAIKQNEKHGYANIIVYSIFDSQALQESSQYYLTDFRFIFINKLIKILDQIIWFIIHNLFRINTIFFKNLLQRILVICKTHSEIKKIVQSENDSSIIMEHSVLLLYSLIGINKGNNRIYFHAHNRIKYTHKLLDSIIERLDGVISVSKYLDSANKQLSEKCIKRFVLKNGIEVQKFVKNYDNSKKYKSLKRKYNPDGKKIILFIGRIDEEKGVLEIVKAFRKLSREDVRLLILGTVFYKKGVHSKYEEIVVNEAKGLDIVFTGFVEYEEVPFFYKMAYLSVLPSKWEEPAGLVMIESMASGIPLITTKKGGIPEYVKDGCRFIDSGINMINDMVSEIQNVLDENKDLYIKESMYAQEIASQYSTERFYFELMNIIN